MFCLSFILLSLTCACVHAQVLTSSTPSLTSTDLTGVSCEVYGLSSYCIVGGACCLDSTCCGIGMQCVASTTTNGYDCEASSQSGSVGAPVSFSSIVFSSHAFSSFNMSVLRTLRTNTDSYQGSSSGSGSGSTNPDKVCVPAISEDGDSWYCQYGQSCGSSQGVCIGVAAGGSGSGSGSGSESSPTATDSASSGVMSTEAVASSTTSAASSEGTAQSASSSSSSAARGIGGFGRCRNSFAVVIAMAVAVGGF